MSSYYLCQFSAADIAVGVIGIVVICAMLCGLICLYLKCALNLAKCDRNGRDCFYATRTR